MHVILGAKNILKHKCVISFLVTGVPSAFQWLASSSCKMEKTYHHEERINIFQVLWNEKALTA